MKNKKTLFIILFIIILIVIGILIKNIVGAAEPCRYAPTGAPNESTCTLGTVYWDGSKCMQHRYCNEKLNCISQGTGAVCEPCGSTGLGSVKDFPFAVSCPGCNTCATAKCGECSSQAAGFRCQCTGSTGIPGYYTSCIGVPDSSCQGSPKKCDESGRVCVATCPSGHYCYGNCVTDNDCGNYSECGGSGQPCCMANGGTCEDGLTCCDPKNGQPRYCTPSCGIGPGTNCPPGYSCQPPGSPCSGERLGAGSCGYPGQNYYCCKSGSSSQGCEIYGMTKCDCSDPRFNKRAPNGDCCCPSLGPSYACTCTLTANPNPIPSGQNTTYITAESKPDPRVPNSDFVRCQVTYYERQYGIPKQVTKTLPANITQNEDNMTYNGDCMYFVYVGSQAYNYDCSCDVTVTKGTTTYKECNANHRCISVAGAGPDQCSSDNDCGHYACNDTGSCVWTAGAGEDECSSDSDCRFSCISNKFMCVSARTGEFKSKADCMNQCGPCSISWLKFLPSKLFLGYTTTADWQGSFCSTCTASTTNPTNCDSTGQWSGDKDPQGSQSGIKPIRTGYCNYSLTCVGRYGKDSKSATVEVYRAPIWREIAPSEVSGFLWSIIFGK